MELSNEFVVGVPPDEAWKVLTDVERIAPCMPGAQLQEIEGDEYRGIVKVKVGPITAQYKGKAHFVERDDEKLRAVLRAEGRDTRGQGNANATITAQLVPEGEGTRVTVTTDLTITGRAAQFGRGVMADVSAKLLGQFVDCLETNLLGGGSGPEPAGETAGSNGQPSGALGATATVGHAEGTEIAPPTGARKIDHAVTEPVDLFGTAGAPVLKRLIPTVVGLLVAWWVERKILKFLRGRRSA